MMRDPQGMLIRAIREGAAPGLTVRAARSERWASATFAGARHRLEFEPIEKAAAAALADRIGRMEFAIPGHLVADIAVVGQVETPAGAALTIEALTVEDG